MNKIGMNCQNRDCKAGQMMYRFKRSEDYVVQKLDRSRAKSDKGFQLADKLTGDNKIGRVWTF